MRFGAIFRPVNGAIGAAALACALLWSSVQADTPAPPALDQIDGAEVSASETVRWLGFRVFDITVFTKGGARYDPDQPAALELRYARNFSKAGLMEATMEEFARLEGPQSDHTVIEKKLQTCFAKVGPGDRFLAVGPARDRVTLFRNDAQTCRLNHPDIRARFLDIWLSLDSRFPAVSRRLRGL